MSVREDLIAARALIDTPEKWCRGSWSYVRPGAAAIMALPDEWRLGLDVSAVARFNDAPTTTHSDIMALFDRAIQAAEASP